MTALLLLPALVVLLLLVLVFCVCGAAGDADRRIEHERFHRGSQGPRA